jgi:hypothetical protein
MRRGARGSCDYAQDDSVVRAAGAVGAQLVVQLGSAVVQLGSVLNLARIGRIERHVAERARFKT